LRLIDRVVAVFTGLLLIMLITVVLLAPDAIVLLFSGVADVNLLARLAIVVVVNILILTFMYLQLRGPRKTTSGGLAVKASGASTDVSVESARTLILNGVKNVKDVVSADVTVEAVSGKADVDLNVQVTGANIHVPNKQKEIDRALRQVINKQLGLQMRGKPRVHIFLQGESLPEPDPVEKKAEPVVEKKADPVIEKPAAIEKPVVAGEDADTLVKVEKPHSFLGMRNREEPKAEEKAEPEKAADDWLDSLDKQKADNEQN
jgi:hypothetical protein